MIQAWKYDIANDPHAAAIFQTLGQSQQQYSIEIVSELERKGSDHFLPNVDGQGLSVIQWDPHGGLISDYLSPTAQGQSPAMGLLHEAGHAYDFEIDPQGYWARSNPYSNGNPWYSPEEEYNIQNNENPAAEIAGEWVRTDHGGFFRYVENVTDVPSNCP